MVIFGAHIARGLEYRKNHAGDIKKKSLVRRKGNKVRVMTGSGKSGGKRPLGQGAGAADAACERFLSKGEISA
ncbi:hypothetical protein N9I56_05185 [Alphaproteobacteria bacterium]|nr:hypothetical protein [Alphaproteobacteria bacterium]